METLKTAAWHAHILLNRPQRVRDALTLCESRGLVDRVPTLWQLELGVLRMLHRMVFRPETIGLSGDFAPRNTRRARWWRARPLRLPFLLWEGSVAPWDLTGLSSRPEKLIRHLLGTHHDGLQFVYDLQILDVYPGALEDLVRQARRVVTVDNARTEWLRDLVVYEGYHETLLAVAERALVGDFALTPDQAEDVDVSFSAYLQWCSQQPPTPRATWRAWRAGTFRFDRPLQTSPAARTHAA